MPITLTPPGFQADSLPLRPLLVHAGEGHFLDLGDHRGRIIVSAAQSGGALLLADMEVDPHGGPPPHMHTHEDELFHILEGRFEFRIGETVMHAGAGETVFAPRRVPHVWRCASETPGRLLGLVTPGANFEAFVTAMAARGFDPAGPVHDPVAAAAFVRFAAEFGIDLLAG
jgi:quercetin dioxygenase-like cupin family protein